MTCNRLYLRRTLKIGTRDGRHIRRNEAGSSQIICSCSEHGVNFSSKYLLSFVPVQEYLMTVPSRRGKVNSASLLSHARATGYKCGHAVWMEIASCGSLQRYRRPRQVKNLMENYWTLHLSSIWWKTNTCWVWLDSPEADMQLINFYFLVLNTVLRSLPNYIMDPCVYSEKKKINRNWKTGDFFWI